tara:strand:+ start:458 stop:988 length:531 start_codon:yes stop_codon:yes gene_type:complete
MKTVEVQLANYKSVHFNKHNIKTHFIGIPLIVWAITLLLSLQSITIAIDDNVLTFTPAMVLLSISVVYYFTLHAKLGFGMLIYVLINIYLASLVSTMEYAFWLAIATFIIGWIIQFIGHIYEKAKPAFLDDIMGLVIGPLFLMAEVYFALGLEKKLHNEITPMAIEKRRLLESTKS